MIYDEDGVARLFEGHRIVAAQLKAYADHVGAKSSADFSQRRYDGKRNIVDLWRATPRGLVAVHEEGSSKADGAPWRTRIAISEWQSLGGIALVSVVDFESSTMALQWGKGVEMEVPDAQVPEALAFVGAVLGYLEPR